VPETKKDAPLKLDITQIGAAPFSLLFKRKKIEVFIIDGGCCTQVELMGAAAYI
jgi:hypothetical protein